MTWDLTIKWRYMSTTRFKDKQLYELYKLCLYIRPLGLAFIMLYHFVIGCKEIYKLRSRVAAYLTDLQTGKLEVDPAPPFNALRAHEPTLQEGGAKEKEEGESSFESEGSSNRDPQERIERTR